MMFLIFLVMGFFVGSTYTMKGHSSFQSLALAVSDGDAPEVHKILLDLTKYSNRKIPKEYQNICIGMLFRAVQNNKFGVVQELLRFGVEVNVIHKKTGNSPLHYAVLFPDPRMLWVILQEKKINFDCVNFQGKTALDLTQKNKELFKQELIKEAIIAQRENRKMQLSSLLETEDKRRRVLRSTSKL